MASFIQFNFPCGHVASYERVNTPPGASTQSSGYINHGCRVWDFQIVETRRVSWPRCCPACFERRQYALFDRYQKQLVDLIWDAAQLRWNKLDVAGSLADITKQFRADLQDFESVYRQPGQPEPPGQPGQPDDIL